MSDVQKKISRSYRITRYVLYKETLIDPRELLWSFIGAFLGIGIIAFVQSGYLLRADNIFLIGSFGASSVLIYGSVQSPLAQPRNLVGGHLISAFLGVSIARFMPDILWINAPLAVALSIICMQITKTLHPPGGATALIAVSAQGPIKEMGFSFILSPVLSGVLILLSVALIFGNMTPHRKYPTNRYFSRTLRAVIRPARIQRIRNMRRK